MKIRFAVKDFYAELELVIYLTCRDIAQGEMCNNLQVGQAVGAVNHIPAAEYRIMSKIIFMCGFILVFNNRINSQKK